MWFWSVINLILTVLVVMVHSMFSLLDLLYIDLVYELAYVFLLLERMRKRREVLIGEITSLDKE
jgi:hypothetical protein